MRGKLIFIAGAALGFVLGSKQGRQAYESLKTKAADTWSNPKVRDGVGQAADLARDKIPGGDMIVAVAEEAAGKVDESTGTSAAATAPDEAPAGESAGDDTATDQSSTPTPATVASAGSSADPTNRD